MNQKFIQFAVEQLYRDPEMQNQETRTAVAKYFGSRDNVDELLSLVQTSSALGVFSYRRDTSKTIMDMIKTEARLRMQISELEGELALANANLKYREADRPSTRKGAGRKSADQYKRYEEPESPTRPEYPRKRKKVRVWTAGKAANAV
jgi:hypothetical protein